MSLGPVAYSAMMSARDISATVGAADFFDIFSPVVFAARSTRADPPRPTGPWPFYGLLSLSAEAERPFCGCNIQVHLGDQVDRVVECDLTPQVGTKRDFERFSI